MTAIQFVKRTVFGLLLVSILTAGCAPAPTPAPTATAQATATQTPTELPTVTDTPLPTATALPTRTPAPTSTPIPPNELADAHFLTSGFLDGWRYFITIESPNPITGEYTAVMGENKEYTCEVMNQFPKRLYCIGRLAKVDDYVPYVVFEKETQRKVFEGKVFIPIPSRKY
jgi:hypothetical protein